MDTATFSQQRAERQKERLRDRGGMWQPVTPGRMASSLLAKYRPQPPQSSPTMRKSLGRKSMAGGGARKSVGAPRKSAAAAVRKSVGASRKSVARALEDDGGESTSKPKAPRKPPKKTTKLTMEPVTASAKVKRKDDQVPVKPKAPASKPKAILPLFMTANDKPPPPPPKSVHPALTGAPLVNQPPPPPKPAPKPGQTKAKRPRMDDSEVSEFVPSPPKRARTSTTKKDAPAKKTKDAAAKKTKEASAPKTKGKPAPKKDALAPKKDAPAPKRKGASVVAKKQLMTPIPEADEEEIDLDLGDWVSDDERDVLPRKNEAIEKRPRAGKAVVEDKPAAKERKPRTKAKPNPSDESAPVKAKPHAKRTPSDADNAPARAKSKPNAESRKRKRAADAEPPKARRVKAEEASPRPARRRRVVDVLSTADSPVKTMHHKYDGKPDPIDCFL